MRATRTLASSQPLPSRAWRSYNESGLLLGILLLLQEV
jgi:hypothetical protein